MSTALEARCFNMAAASSGTPCHLFTFVFSSFSLQQSHLTTLSNYFTHYGAQEEKQS
jgi:hypothetical protein